MSSKLDSNMDLWKAREILREYSIKGPISKNIIDAYEFFSMFGRNSSYLMKCLAGDCCEILCELREEIHKPKITYLTHIKNNLII